MGGECAHFHAQVSRLMLRGCCTNGVPLRPPLSRNVTRVALRGKGTQQADTCAAQETALHCQLRCSRARLTWTPTLCTRALLKQCKLTQFLRTSRTPTQRPKLSSSASNLHLVRLRLLCFIGIMQQLLWVHLGECHQ